MVVDDEDGHPHAVIVAERRRKRIVASRNTSFELAAMCRGSAVSNVGRDSI